MSDKINQVIYDLLPDTHPLLTQEMTDLPPKDQRWEIALNLINTMKAKKGIGLAANQVGLPYRCFVMDGVPPLAIFNPRVIDMSTEEIILEEGCLTFPGLNVKIKRPKHIKVRYEDADGEVHTEKFTGMTARIFLHEMDHLNGYMFYQRASLFHRDQGFRRWKNWKRKNVL